MAINLGTDFRIPGRDVTRLIEMGFMQPVPGPRSAMNTLNPSQKSSLCASRIASVVAREALPIAANLNPRFGAGGLIQFLNLARISCAMRSGACVQPRRIRDDARFRILANVEGSGEPSRANRLAAEVDRQQEMVIEGNRMSDGIPPTPPRGKRRIDFSTLSAELLNRARYLLPTWMPGGHWEGYEWVAINSTRSDNGPGSFRAIPKPANGPTSRQEIRVET